MYRQRSRFISYWSYDRVLHRIHNISFVRWLRSDRYLLIHALEAKNALPEIDNDKIHCNCQEDLSFFEQTERWLTHDDFLKEAEGRLAEGMHLYTSVVDQKLLHYSWLVPRQERAWFPYVKQYFNFPEGAAVLFNAYTHPAARGTGMHIRSMRRRIADAASMAGTTTIYTAIESHNLASRAVAAKAGFVCVDVLYEIIRFGRARQGRMPPDTYFSTVESVS